jgi:hypothetical protein
MAASIPTESGLVRIVGALVNGFREGLNPSCRCKFVHDGQITKSLSSPSHKNISLTPSGKSSLEPRASHPNEGRVAIVTNVAVGCDGRERCC